MSEINLMPFQDQPFNGDIFMELEFLKLKEKFGIQCAIETGSCLYSTTKWLSENFAKVYTFEINEEFANHGKHKISGNDNVNAIIGDSVYNLKMFAYSGEVNTSMCIFFLDAHWGDHCPLIEEIEAISSIPFAEPPVIVIHDFYTGNPLLGYDCFPNGWEFSYEAIEDSVRRLEASFSTKYSYYYNAEAEGAMRGVIYLVPMY